MTLFRPLQNKRRLVGAHRGYRSIRPENTLSAFDASLGHCDFIELDVQMSRDGVAVITHDDELGRTCNALEMAVRLGKKSLRVDHWDLAELRQLDFGGWFLAADPFETIKNGELDSATIQHILPQPILTLAELLEWRAKVQIPLNIEIKDQQGGVHDTAVVEAVLHAIGEANCVSDILISSFRHDYLRQVRRNMPEITLGALQENNHPADLIGYLKDLKVDAYHPAVERISGETIRELRDNGFLVNVFTVNNKIVQQQLFDDGVTSVITDFPDLQVTAA